MKHYNNVKTLKDGRAMLNLGCGTKMHWDWTNIDFSPYARLAHHKLLGRTLRRVGLLSDQRYGRLLEVDPKIICWDLRKGIPYNDNVFDVVYHSHFLTHIDKEHAPYILRECYRVLKRNGIIRVVVPDLQGIVRRYTDAISAIESGDKAGHSMHEDAISELFELMVRLKPRGTSLQRPLVRMVERLIRGNAFDIAEARRWHYDKYSLGTLLYSLGFQEVECEDAFTSRIPGWSEFGLDCNEDGTIYKPGSLHMEGVK